MKSTMLKTAWRSTAVTYGGMVLTGVELLPHSTGEPVRQPLRLRFPGATLAANQG